jgi:hypothetical protein
VVGLLLSAGVAGCGGGGSSDADAAAPKATPSQLSFPTVDADLAPGTYAAPVDESTAVRYSITFPAGWRVQAGNEFYLHEDEAGGIGILPFVVDEIYADACRGDRGPVTKVGPRVQALVDALLAQPGPAKSTPVQTTLGGKPATRIDLRVPQRLQTQSCFGGPGTGVQLWLSEPARYMVLGPHGMVSVYVVNVGGQRQVFTVQYDPAHISAADRKDLTQILDSIHFEG